MDKKEIWKTAVVDGVEHPRYQVSNLGRVKNMDFRGTGKPRMCRLTKNSKGYLCVWIDGVNKKVHRIVAEAFIPNPEGKPCIDHTNTVKTDNVVLLDNDGKTILYTNLRWCTCEENNNNPLSIKNMSENNQMRGKFGADCPNSIAIIQLTLDGKFIKKWSAAMEVQRELGINQSSIIQCCKGKVKSAGGYRWMYYSEWLKTLRKKSLSEIKPLF